MVQRRSKILIMFPEQLLILESPQEKDTILSVGVLIIREPVIFWSHGENRCIMIPLSVILIAILRCII